MDRKNDHNHHYQCIDKYVFNCLFSLHVARHILSIVDKGRLQTYVYTYKRDWACNQ